MKNFIAVPIALAIYFLVLTAIYYLLGWILEDTQWQSVIVVFVMGVLSAVAVKIFISEKYSSPFFGDVALILLGISFGFAALFAFTRNLEVMDCGFEYVPTFFILSVTALFFGTR